VVIGIEPDQDDFILRNGQAGRQFITFDAFDRAWAPGRQWAMVTTRADELPATATADQWIRAADSATKAGKPRLAETMISTAMAKWGETTGSWVAMGNARFAARDLNGASLAYRKAIELKPDNAVAHNNYAEVLLDRHCIDDAQEQIEAALNLETDPAIRQRYEGTQVMIAKHAGPSVYCPELAEGDAPPTRFEGAPVDLNTLPARPAPRLRKPPKSH
jgi:tetratricopeptide (TPR) repeat protein